MRRSKTMRITSQEEYGLRCALQLAAKGKDRLLTSGEIAEEEGISVPYVNKLLNILKHAGIVETIRGNRGGYRLSRDPSQINLADVLKALDSPLFGQGFCEKFTGLKKECVHVNGSCCIRSVWSVLAEQIEGVLSQTTLEEIGQQREGVMTMCLRIKEQAVCLDKVTAYKGTQ